MMVTDDPALSGSSQFISLYGPGIIIVDIP